MPFADVSQTLVFLMASHSISIYLFATCFTLQYCANREDVLIFFLFYDPEFLHSRQRFHLSFFPLHKERKNCWNSQIKSVDIREREKKREDFTRLDDFHHTLCYQLNCCHIIIKMIQLHPSLFCIVLYFRKIILYSRVSHRDRSLFGANIIESFCEGKEPFFVTLRQVCDQDGTFKEMVAQRNR